jgi:hypothetical protein
VVAETTGGLVELMATLAETNDELVRAAAENDMDRVTDLMRQAAGLERQRNALLRGAGARRPAQYATAVPLATR